jgi:hypothetical protein
LSIPDVFVVTGVGSAEANLFALSALEESITVSNNPSLISSTFLPIDFSIFFTGSILSLIFSFAFSASASSKVPSDSATSLISSTAVETTSTDSPSSSVAEPLSSSSNEPSSLLSFDTSSAFLSTFSIGFPAFTVVFLAVSSAFSTGFPTFIWQNLYLLIRQALLALLFLVLQQW